MKKSIYDDIVNKFEEVGITNYMVCDSDSNNELRNDETSIIFSYSDKLIGISICRNSGVIGTDSVFDFGAIEFDTVSNVKALSMTYEQGIALMEKFGYANDERFKNLLKSFKPRTANNPGVGGQMKMFIEEVPVLDDDGNPVKDDNGNHVTKSEVVLPKGMNHYIV